MSLHPDLLLALPHMRAAGEANWYVLTAYILHANARGRAWPSLDTLCRETGYARPAVIAARQWLVRAGALAKVNYALRIGDERTHPRKEVMQLTGVIQLPGRAEPLRVTALTLPADDAPPGPSDLAIPLDRFQGQPGLPQAAGSAPPLTPDGQPGLPESAATAAPTADPVGGGADALSPVALSLRGVGLVWQQEARQPLTPLLADILAELVERHGVETVVGAVREAVQAVGPGKFSVKYVVRILERWRAEGPGEAQERPSSARRPRRAAQAASTGQPDKQVVDFSEGRTLV